MLYLLRRIAQLDSNLRAYITVTGDLALEQVGVPESEIARGAYRGPFHGIQIGLKDLRYTKRIRTTGEPRNLPISLRIMIRRDGRDCAMRAPSRSQPNLHEIRLWPDFDQPPLGRGAKSL